MRVLATTVLTVPVVLGADAVTTGTAPGPGALLLVTAAVLAATALVTRVVRPTRAALATAAVTGQLAGHAALLLLRGDGGAQGCLPVVGRGAGAGLRLALLRPDPACPPGTLAVAPVASAAAGAVVVALLVLLLHAVAATLTSVLLAAGEFSLAAVRALAALVAPVRAALPPALPRRARAPLTSSPLGLTAARYVPAAHGRRGPPRVAARVC